MKLENDPRVNKQPSQRMRGQLLEIIVRENRKLAAKKVNKGA